MITTPLSCTDDQGLADDSFVWPDSNGDSAAVESISLSFSSYTLPLYGEVQMVATVTADDMDEVSLVWSSSNKEVASVDETGLVTALAQGETTITVASGEAGSTVSASCAITVSEEYISVFTLSFDSSALPDELVIGEEYTLGVVFNGGDESQPSNQYIIWTSSDTSIATVSEGVITAVGTGEAVITATSVDDSNITATYTATIMYLAVEGITDIITASELRQGESGQLLAVFYPTGASVRDCTWSIVEGDDYASVDSETGVITAEGVGGLDEITVKVKAVSVENPLADLTADVTIYPAVIQSVGAFSEAVAIGNGNSGNQCVVESLLTPIYSEATSYEWSSLTPAIASVEGDSATATITGLSEGMATILLNATSVDGFVISNTFVIEVIDGEPLMINPDFDGAVYAFNENSVQLTTLIGEADAWEITSGEATVSDSGLVTFTGRGDITIKATNDYGSEDSVTISVPHGYVLQTYFDSNSATWDFDMLYSGASREWNENGYLTVTSAVTNSSTCVCRADFECVNPSDIALNSVYYVFAVRIDDVALTDYVMSRVLYPVTKMDGQSSTNGKSSTPCHYYYWLSDGSSIIGWHLPLSGVSGAYALYTATTEDSSVGLTSMSFAQSAMTPTSTAAVTGDNADLFPYKWNLYSVHTFKGSSDIQDYIENKLGLAIKYELAYDQTNTNISATLTDTLISAWVLNYY